MAGERWKLVLSSEPELFDLTMDPGEQKNVAAEQPRIVEGMTARLQAALKEPGAGSQSGAIAADAAERLRALGYVSGSTTAASSGPNPARVIDAWTTFEQALGEVTTGRARNAIPSLRGLVQRFPDAPIFQSTYARALKDTGQVKEALAFYKRAVARNSRDASLFHDLAVAARAAGDEAEALRAEQAALALNGDDPLAINGLGLIHIDAGRFAEAAAQFERAASLDRGNASYWANLGNARHEMNDAAGADQAYTRALEADPSFPDALNGRGVILVKQKRPLEAIPLFERALQRSPDFHEARLNLGVAYQESGNMAKAVETYRWILANAPPSSRERAAARELLAQFK
jgi:tetratricopeptide (TPR) repeat protein